MPKEKDDITLAIIVATTLFFILGLFVLVIFLLYKKRQKSYKDEKTILQRDFQQALLQTQIEIQEQTLKTISEEIHDNIGQILSLAKLNLNTFPTDISPAVQTQLVATKQLVSKAINDLRDLSRSLHGDKVAELGLEEAVANELKIIQNTGMFDTSIQVTGTSVRLSAQQQMVLFRMVQEALNNAIKHSKASEIKVDFYYLPTHFKLDIADNGAGFDVQQHAANGGLGLKSMPNRALLIGGEFSVLSTAENGTVVSIRLPLNTSSPTHLP